MELGLLTRPRDCQTPTLYSQLCQWMGETPWTNCYTSVCIFSYKMGIISTSQRYCEANGLMFVKCLDERCYISAKYYWLLCAMLANLFLAFGNITSVLQNPLVLCSGICNIRLDKSLHTLNRVQTLSAMDL